MPLTPIALDGSTRARSSAPPGVSVVIPCLNEAQYITGVLDALAAQEYADFEILVVDGGSTDGTLQQVAHWQAVNPHIPLRVLDNPHGTIPHGLNQGIRQSPAIYIVRLDGHTRPPPAYIRRGIEQLQLLRVGLVGGPILVVPGRAGPVGRAIALAVSSPLGAGGASYRVGGSQPELVDTVPYGCFRRDTWEALGGYNLSLSANEDYEFNFRLRQAGYLIYLDPEMRCSYFARPTLVALAGQYWRYGWWKMQMLRQHPSSLKLRQLVPIVWGMAAALGLLLSLFFPAIRVWVLAAWGIYAMTLVIESLRLTGTDWKTGLALAGAYGVIHFTWCYGFWAALFKPAGNRQVE
jgi:succinoglycan biosynthesis protein ExoA